MARNYMYDNKNKNENRSQRESEQVNLRAQKREDLLQKKRTIIHIQHPILIENRKKIFTSDLHLIYEGVYEIRRILSVEHNPPIDNIIDSNLLPRVAELLNQQCPLYDSFTKDENLISVVNAIRLECAWIITNIASGSSKQTDSVVKLGLVKSLIDILNEDDIAMIDQSVWALGNIGGDSEIFRDLIIEYNGGFKIIDLFCRLTDFQFRIDGSFVALNQNFMKVRNNANIKMLRNCIWLLSNLLRGRDPQPNYGHMKLCYEFFSYIVFCDDEEIVKDSLWALSYIVDCSIEIGDGIIQSPTLQLVFNLIDNLVKRLNKIECDSLIEKMAKFCLMPILRLLGNIITGTDEQTFYLTSYNNNVLLPYLYEIYYKYNEIYKLTRIRKEICWILSNIAAGPKDQVDLLINCNMHLLLIDSLHNAEIHVKNESCHAILNLLQHVQIDEKIYKIINQSLVEALFFYLDLLNEAKFQALVLACYKMILEAGEYYGMCSGSGNEVINYFDENVIDMLEDLQTSDDKEVHEVSKELIIKYFGGVVE